MKKVILVLSALLFLNCAEQDFDYDYDQEVYEYNNNYYEEGDMALNPNTEPDYVGRIAGADGDYPYGHAQDETTAGADDGTPQTARFRSDVWGFLQGLLLKASIVPSGDPDIALGQYRTALDTMPITLTQLAEGSTVITAGDRVFSLSNLLLSYVNTSTGANTVLTESFVSNTAASGTTYELSADLFGGGVSYAGTTPGTAVTTRRNSFVNPFASVTYSSGVLTIDDQVVLTGVPVGAAVHNVGIYYERTAVPNRRVYIPMTCEFSYGSTWLTVEKMVGLTAAGGVPLATGNVVMYIDYDPSSVD